MVEPSPENQRMSFQIEPLADPALRTYERARAVTTAFVDRAPRASSPRWLGTAVRFSPINGFPEELGWWCPQATEPPALPSASTAKRPPCRCGAALLTIEAVLTSGRSTHLEVSSRRRTRGHRTRAGCGRGIRASSHTARQCPANLCHGPLAHTPPRPRRRSGAQPFAPSQHWQVKVAAEGASRGETRACLTAASIPHCTPAKLVRCPHRALSCQPRCQRRASPSTRPARGGGGPALISPAIASQR